MVVLGFSQGTGPADRRPGRGSGSAGFYSGRHRAAWKGPSQTLESAV